MSRAQIPLPLKAEQGRSASFDVSRSDGPVSYTVTLFASRVQSPIDVEPTAHGLVLTNLAEPTTNRGVELLGTWRHEPFSLTGTSTHVRSRDASRACAFDAWAPLDGRTVNGGVRLMF